MTSDKTDLLAHCGIVGGTEPERMRMKLSFKQGVFADAQAVRTMVFMDEQGFEDEFDDIDELPTTLHITLYSDSTLVGCARIFPDSRHGEEKGRRWVFGRLAVVPTSRHGGFGAALLKESERLAQEAGATEMHLHAQCSVVSFYQRAGYEPYGPIEREEHVEHRWMRKSF